MNRLLLLILVITFASCKKETTDPPPTQPPSTTPADNDHLLLGNPTNATSNAAIGSNYYKDNFYYKLAYHAARGIPVWVSWHLESSDIGTTPRQDNFRPDNLPSSYYAVGASSYSGSGFDRGHNVPSADRTSSVPANSSTFVMSNMIPQAPKLNQGPWEGLEDFLRNTLVGTTKEAFIVMGNYGRGGKGSNGFINEIDNGNVTVPASVWKMAVVMPKGNNDLSRIDTSVIVLTVNMPNDNDLYSTTASGKDDWRDYIITVDSLEKVVNGAGVNLNLMTNVSGGVRSYLKQKKYY